MFYEKTVDEMTRKELIAELCGEHDEQYDNIKRKRTETLRKLLIEAREECEAELYPNGRDYDAEDEDWP